MTQTTMTREEVLYTEAYHYAKGFAGCMKGIIGLEPPVTVLEGYGSYYSSLVKDIENEDAVPEHALAFVNYLKEQIDALGEDAPPWM